MSDSNISVNKLQKEFNDLSHKYEKLLKTQSLKDELIVMLVHDLKSPLSSLMENLKAGYNEIDSLLKQIPGAVSSQKVDEVDLHKYNSSLQKEQNCIESANSDAQLLWRRVTNLLDIKKMEENKMHLELSEFTINGLVDEAVSDLKMMANHHHVNITSKNLDEKVLVYTDYDLILRVLTNLLSNAIKHSDKEVEGKGEVKLKVIDEGENLQFEVQDSGLGVPEGFQKLLFEKFTQLKRVKGSTGLGLTFSKLAIESLQGQIGSKNIDNNGAQFYFSIPKTSKQKDSVDEEDKFDANKWQFS